MQLSTKRGLALLFSNGVREPVRLNQHLPVV